MHLIDAVHKMEAIILPEHVVLRLTAASGEPLRLARVLFVVRVFSTVGKNDLLLGPFAMDENGVASVKGEEIQAFVASNYDAGLMDHGPLSTFTLVKITVMEPDEVERALRARTTVLTRLLDGERQRWATLADLCDLYRTAKNHSLSALPVRDRWDGKKSTYEYARRNCLRASIRANSRNEGIEAIASEMFRRVAARSPAVTGFASRITLSRLILVFCPVNV